MSILTKAFEQYFYVVLLIIRARCTFKVCGWNPSVWPFKWFQAVEQHFHVLLFIMLHKVLLTFKSVDKTLVCDHSNESYWAVLSCGMLSVQGCSNFQVRGWNPSVWPFKWKLLSSTLMWYCLLRCTRWFYLVDYTQRLTGHRPFEPQTAIVRGLFVLCSSRRHAFPAWSLMTESSFKITA